jgi:hypothetical protein
MKSYNMDTLSRGPCLLMVMLIAVIIQFSVVGASGYILESALKSSFESFYDSSFKHAG